MGAEYLDKLREEQGLPPLEEVAGSKASDQSTVTDDCGGFGWACARALEQIDAATAKAACAIVGTADAAVNEVVAAIVPPVTPEQPQPVKPAETTESK